MTTDETTGSPPSRRALLLRSGGAGDLLRAVGEGGLLRRRPASEELRMPVEHRTAPGRLWADLHARLRGFVGRRIGDPHAADDVAQEVLLRLHRNLGELRAEDRLDAFAYRIARNAIIDHYRSRASAKETPAAPDDLIARIEADGGADEDPTTDAAARSSPAASSRWSGGCPSPTARRSRSPTSASSPRSRRPSAPASPSPA